MKLQNGSEITFLNLDAELSPRITVRDSHANSCVTEEVAADISRENLFATLSRMIGESGPFFRPSGKSLRICLDERLRGAMLSGQKEKTT